MVDHSEILSALRDARLIASPYAKASDDPNPVNRDLAGRYDALIARVERQPVTGGPAASDRHDY